MPEPEEALLRRAAQTRVEIDLNVRVRGRQTYAGLEDAGGPVAVGDSVLAIQSDDQIEFDAEVTDIDRDSRLIYLAVDWPSGRDWSVTAPVGDDHQEGQP